MKLILFLFFMLCQPIAAQDIDGTWKGTLEAGTQRLTIVLRVSTAQNTVTMDVPEQGVERLPLKVNTLRADCIDVAFDRLALRIAVVPTSGALVGRFQQGMFATPLTLRPGTVTYNRPQQPQPPYPYETRQVTFRNDNDCVLLAGILTLPVGYKQGRRVPVALMVTGSGPQNRDEELFHHKPFFVMADYLARHGIATLRYDDRGVAASTGNFATATTHDFVADARCGLAWLKATRMFSKVGVVGHSEGGMVAFMLASEHLPDFIVSLAGPACRIDTMMVMQLNGLGKAQGATANVVTDTREVRSMLLRQADTPWMRQFIDTDMRPYVRATRCPVLALGGEADLNVPPAINTPALKAGLSHNQHATIKVYPGLSHSFQFNPSGLPSNAVNIDQTIAPCVLADIARWINAL